MCIPGDVVCFAYIINDLWHALKEILRILCLELKMLVGRKVVSRFLVRLPPRGLVRYRLSCKGSFYVCGCTEIL